MKKDERIYLCIDLKSFYASVECVERNLPSLETKLVVADPARGDGAICLAVSPALKALGVRNRCRVFEIPKDIDYIMAVPRMNLYIKYSADIYGIYLKYIAKEDIYVYSIDECFMDVTNYLELYKKDVKELAKIMIDDVYKTTGICATAGIGTNLFLCKVALDVTAKHVDDHIGYLDEEKFKKEIWFHEPITDIWQIARGYANRLLKYNVKNLYDITQLDEAILYKEFGVNAEILIDHAYGKEPTTIKQIHAYKPKSNSLSNSQILFENYSYDNALLALKEMVDLQVREMVGRHLACLGVSLFIGYSSDKEKPVSASCKLDDCTNSYKTLWPIFEKLYKKHVNKNLLIRRIGIGFGGIISEEYITYNLFSNIEDEKKEKDLQLAILDIQSKYGKNAILKGMNYKDKATTKLRNKLVGGHNAD